jgi:AhpC/TSA family
VTPLSPGSGAPPIEGADLAGRRSVLFYKVTCPTCQLVAPVAERLYRADPDAFVAVGQDPPDRIERFATELGTTFPTVAEAPPYPVSEAWGVRTVPTLFVVEEGRVADVVESWDREGWNRATERLVGEAVSHQGDGLPPFRPG